MDYYCKYISSGKACMDEIDKIKTALHEYKKQVMEAPFSDVQKLIEKYGADIDDDWVFMYLSSAIISEHEKLWGEDKYKKELSVINNKIDAILARYELGCVEEFDADKKPAEIDELLKNYDDLWDRKQSLLFEKYGLNNFAEFYLNDKLAYLQRLERIKKDNNYPRLNLGEVINELEIEANKCSEIQAFNAATILLASAIEGLLLDVARKDERFLKAFIDKNKKNKKKSEILSLSLSQIFTIFKEANIYPFNDENDVRDMMFEITNLVRNLIHPGRKIKTKYPKTTEQEYIFLKNIYTYLKDQFPPTKWG